MPESAREDQALIAIFGIVGSLSVAALVVVARASRLGASILQLIFSVADLDALSDRVVVDRTVAAGIRLLHWRRRVPSPGAGVVFALCGASMPDKTRSGWRGSLRPSALPASSEFGMFVQPNGIVGADLAGCSITRAGAVALFDIGVAGIAVDCGQLVLVVCPAVASGGKRTHHEYATRSHRHPLSAAPTMSAILSLRPQTLSEFVGQARRAPICRSSSTPPASAAEALDHMLFVGPAGPRQDHAGADRGARARRRFPCDIRAGDRQGRRSCGTADQSRRARCAVHRRDPPSQSCR